MIDFDYIVFHGERSSGRSTLLFTIADICKSNGEICYFFGATDEFNSDYFIFESTFSRKFFYRHPDHRLIENIVELSDKERCNYIFIDDIDFLSRKDLQILSKSKAKKIVTSLTGKIPEITNYKSYEIVTSYEENNKLFPKVDKFLYSDDCKISVTDFLKTLERDKKINLILK